MFLASTIKKNKALIEYSFALHQKGQILPDTYVIDIDQLLENAKEMLKDAKKYQIELYFMLKQVGRNPYIAKKLIQIGYKGAVVVDYKEARVMMKHHIPICNVGHLVQCPKSEIKQLCEYGCDYFTVFSFEKMKEIDAAAHACGKIQKVLLKVVDEEDHIYSGQTAGFMLNELPLLMDKFRSLSNIQISGVTSFPCFLHDDKQAKLIPTHNFLTLQKAKELLLHHGFLIENINAPSATCCATLATMAQHDVQSAEPGHALTGTTPLHANQDCTEKPCVTYVSEVSHNFKDKGYCYGGGHYRRSHMANALVGKSIADAKIIEVVPPDLDSIDYYFELEHPSTINDTVIMAFRFQIFVTRSHVAIVEGLHAGNPHVVGIYNSLGDEIDV